MIHSEICKELYEFVLASSAKIRKEFIELTQKILDEILKFDKLIGKSVDIYSFDKHNNLVQEIRKQLENLWNFNKLRSQIVEIEKNYSLVQLPLSINKAISTQSYIYILSESGFVSIYSKKFSLLKTIELNNDVIDIMANDKYFVLATSKNQIFTYNPNHSKIISSINLDSEYKLGEISNNIVLVVTKDCKCIKFNIQSQEIIKEITIYNDRFEEDTNFNIDFIEISNRYYAFGSKYSGKIFIYSSIDLTFKISIYSANLLASICFYNEKDILLLDHDIRKKSYEIFIRDVDELCKLSLGSDGNANESITTKGSTTHIFNSIDFENFMDSDWIGLTLWSIEDYIFIYGHNGKILWSRNLSEVNIKKFTIDDSSYPICFFKDNENGELVILSKSGNIHRFDFDQEPKNASLQLVNNQIEISSICPMAFYILLGTCQGDIFVYSSSMIYLKTLNYHTSKVSSIQGLASSFFSLSTDSKFIEWDSKSFEILRVLTSSHLSSFILNTSFILSIYSDKKFSITQNNPESQVKKFKVNSAKFDLICHKNSNLFALFDSKGVVKYLDANNKTHHFFDTHINAKLLFMTQDNCLIFLEEEKLNYFDFETKEKIFLGIFDNVKAFAMDELCLFMISCENVLLKFDLTNDKKEIFYLKDNVIIEKMLIHDRKLIFYGFPSYCAVFDEGVRQEMVLNDLNVIVKESSRFRVFGLMNGSVFVQIKGSEGFKFYYKMPNSICFICVNEESIIAACTDLCLIITEQNNNFSSKTYQIFENIPIKYQHQPIKPYFILKSCI